MHRRVNNHGVRLVEASLGSLSCSLDYAINISNTRTDNGAILSGTVSLARTIENQVPCWKINHYKFHRWPYIW